MDAAVQEDVAHVGANRTKKPDGSSWSPVYDRARNGQPIAPAAICGVRVAVARVAPPYEADHDGLLAPPRRRR